MKRFAITLPLTITLLCAPPHVHADSISLKSSVRFSGADKVITLGDIAELSGERAQALAALPIAQIKAVDQAVEISIQDVREKLNEAGVHWGHVNLSGRSVVVRPLRSADVAPPQAMTSVAIDDHAFTEQSSTKRDECLAADLIKDSTIGGMIADLIITNMRMAPNDVRLSFLGSDREFLNGSVQSRRIEVQPLTSVASDRIDLAVRTWAGEQVQSTTYISAVPQVRVRAAVLRNDVTKDQLITDEAIVPAEQWLAPSQASLTVDPISAIGALAAKSMKAGETLRHKHLRRDALIKRGDLVIVRCLVGGVAISLQAEARADGAEGETIEFRKTGERETFLATVNARGEAVVNLSQR